MYQIWVIEWCQVYSDTIRHAYGDGPHMPLYKEQGSCVLA